MEYKTKNTADTEALGARLAKEVSLPHTFCLKGDLGAGKTAFTRGLARGCGYKGRVSSPTFTIMNIYNCDGFDINHYDLYRISDEEELREIGFDAQAEGCITVVEWFDGYEHLFPAENTTYVTILRTDEDENFRIIEVRP